MSTPGSMLDLSIIVPFHNASRSILPTLKALEASTVRPLEIILVNDGSTDDIADIVGRFIVSSASPVRCLPSSWCRRGAAAARNAGAQEAKGSVLLFVDADVVVEPNTIQRMYESLRQQQGLAIVAQFADHSLQKGVLAHFQAFLVSLTYSRLDSDSPCLGSQCVMLAADTFRRVGEFAESFAGATVEDFDMGYRLRELGGRIRIQREARIVHNHRYSIRSFLRNYYLKARDLAFLLLETPSVKLSAAGYYSLSRLLAIPVFLTGLAMIVGSAIIRRWSLFPLGCLLLGSQVFLERDFVVQAVRRCSFGRALVLVLLHQVVLLLGEVGAVVGILRFISRHGISACGHNLHMRLRETLTSPRNRART